MKLNKEQAAVRQLDCAIELMFRGGDAVSVHTLAAAASGVFADLNKHLGSVAWRRHAEGCYPGREAEVRRVLSKAQNFFKHANKDPEAVLEFDDGENDEKILFATLEYGVLLGSRPPPRGQLTLSMSMFQFWYFAKSPEALLEAPYVDAMGLVAQAQSLFPELSKFPRFQQLSLGASALKKAMAEAR